MLIVTAKHQDSEQSKIQSLEHPYQKLTKKIKALSQEESTCIPGIKIILLNMNIGNYKKDKAEKNKLFMFSS